MKLLKTLMVGWIIFAGAVFQVTAQENNPLQKIGVSVSDLGNPFFVQIAESVTNKARDLVGDSVQVLVRSNAYNLQRQLRQIDEFIEKEMDLIVLVAADYEGVGPGVRQAQQAGIKVVAVDVNAAHADLTITTDNVQAGKIACDYLVEKLGTTGNWVIINGPQVSSVIERVSGCKSVLKHHPGIQLLSDQRNGGGSFEGGMEAMTYLLNAYPHIDAVFSINDPSALGAAKAAEQAGRKEFLIGSVDGAPAAKQAIAQPQSLWVTSAAQFPQQMAERAVEQGLQLLQGKSISSTVILIPAQLITLDNAQAFESWDQ